MIRIIDIPMDIMSIITSEFDFVGQCNVRLISKNFTKCPITNLFDNVPHIDRLSDKILESYPLVTKLNAYNKRISNWDKLINLRKLYANRNCKINNNDIN